jgi:hypothetical protein
LVKLVATLAVSLAIDPPVEPLPLKVTVWGVAVLPYESAKMAVTPESEGLTLHAVLMAEAVESRR